MGQVNSILDNSGLSAYIHTDDGNNKNNKSKQTNNKNDTSMTGNENGFENFPEKSDEGGGGLSTTSRLNLMCGSIGDTLDTATKVRTACIDVPKDMLDEQEEALNVSSYSAAGNAAGGNAATTPAKSEASRILARALLSPAATATATAAGGGEKNNNTNVSPKQQQRRNSNTGSTTPKRDKSSSNSSTSPSSASAPYRTPPPSNNNNNNNNSLHHLHLHPLSEHRAQLASSRTPITPVSNTITIGLSLSRRHSTVGHPDTVTRQTAFDFNELQDRSYKFVSSTDSSGWRAGGGEADRSRSGSSSIGPAEEEPFTFNNSNSNPSNVTNNNNNNNNNSNTDPIIPHKVAAPDTVHIPIIQIDCEHSAAVDAVISAIACGDVFIPHMSVMPEALSVNGVSPPDLVVRFGCERNDDDSPDHWPNWCLEFIHNQLYELFGANSGAVWTKRPFQITLAKKVRWKTVKHMNQFFAHSEKVISAWREKGPQYLDPQLSYIEGGATPEEVGRPHGIYLLRDGRATNYFPPNLEPPYTSKMTRSLLMNVLNKSWDRKKRDWANEPSRGNFRKLSLANPTSLLSTICGFDSTVHAPPVAAARNAAHNRQSFENQQQALSNQHHHHPSNNNNNNNNNNSRSLSVFSSPTNNNNGNSNLVVGSEKAAERKSDSAPPEIPMDLSDDSDDHNNEERTINTVSDNNSDHVHLVNSPRESEAGASQISDYAFRMKEVQSEKSKVKMKMNLKRKDEESLPADEACDDGNDEPGVAKEEELVEVAAAAAAAAQKDDMRYSSSNESSPHGSAVSAGQQPRERQDEMFVSQRQSPATSDDAVSVTSSQSDKEKLTSKSAANVSVTASNTTITTSNMDRIDAAKAIIQAKKKHETLYLDRETRRRAKREKKKEKDLLIASTIAAVEQGSSQKEFTRRSNNKPMELKKKGRSLEVEKRETARSSTSRVYEMEPEPVKTTQPQATTKSPIKQSFSQASMEYSLDSMSLSAAQQTDNSVTNQTLFSYVTQETVRAGKEIPTDDELKAIGWAKAFDPKSQLYYYYNLDRSKTSWDNPLAAKSSADQGEI